MIGIRWRRSQRFVLVGLFGALCVLVAPSGARAFCGFFVAGSDALAVVKPALEARLEELRAYEDLSKSTDGSFCA